VQVKSTRLIDLFVSIDGQMDITSSFRTNRKDPGDHSRNSCCRVSGFWAYFTTSVLGEGQHTMSLKIVTADTKE
jgi:hypothetical protein